METARFTFQAKSGAFLVAIFFYILGTLNAIRLPLVQLFFLLFTAGFSRVAPSPKWMESQTCVLVLLLISGMLTGAGLPRVSCAGVRQQMCIVFTQFIISPTLGILVFSLMRFYGLETMFGIGLLYFSCMPPSTLLSELSCKEAGGRFMLCRHFNVFTSLASSFFTPFLFSVLSPLIGSTPIQFYRAPFAIFNFSFFISILSGILIELIYAKAVSKRRLDLTEYSFHRGLPDSRREATEIGEGAGLQQWCGRYSLIAVFLVFLLYYIIFSHINGFYAFGDLKIAGNGYAFSPVLLCYLLWFVLMLSSGWLMGKFFCNTPEDRISFFFAATFKSELFVLPVSFCFMHVIPVRGVEARALLLQRLMLFISLIGFFIIQVLLIIPLRNWRLRSSCRRGTMLLPSRLDKSFTCSLK